MIDHRKNLEEVSAANKQLVQEISELTTAITLKKEIALKYAGIIEYLTQVLSSEESESAKDAEVIAD